MPAIRLAVVDASDDAAAELSFGLVEQTRGGQQVVQAGGNRCCDMILLRPEKRCQPVCIEAILPLLLTQHAQNHRAKHAQDRIAGAFADASELADGLGQRAHRSVAEQARQQACAAFRERLRICAAHKALQAFEGAELLLRHDIAELARAVRGRGHVRSASR